MRSRRPSWCRARCCIFSNIDRPGTSRTPPTITRPGSPQAWRSTAEIMEERRICRIVARLVLTCRFKDATPVAARFAPVAAPVALLHRWHYDCSVPMSPELRLMVSPRAAYAALARASGRGTAWTAVRRPLTVALVLGAGDGDVGDGARHAGAPPQHHRLLELRRRPPGGDCADARRRSGAADRRARARDRFVLRRPRALVAVDAGGGGLGALAARAPRHAAAARGRRAARPDAADSGGVLPRGARDRIRGTPSPAPRRSRR